MIILASTRFNNDTWNENHNFRTKNNLPGCIYCSPQNMSCKIELGAIVFVVEMNNTKNEIEGIGLIQNTPITEKAGIYETRNFNRYIFVGDYRINRDIIIRYHPNIVQALDHILFKEKTHLKRGAGMTQIPEKLLNHQVCQGINIKKEIKDMFIRHFSKNQSEFDTTKDTTKQKI